MDQPKTIHQQDDHELMLHIETSWQSLVETVRELRNRGNEVALSIDPTIPTDITRAKWIMR